MIKRIPRVAQSYLESASKHFPVVVIVGARQVGKTTLLHELFGSTFHYVTFDEPNAVQQAQEDPELFLSNHPTPLILDEIQYAPQIVRAIKYRVDKNIDQPGQYYLTGSQQWSVMKSLTESLAGRARILHLDGLMLSELKGADDCSPWLASYLDSPEVFLQDLVYLYPLKTYNERMLYEQLWRGFLPKAQLITGDLVPGFHQSYQRTYIERDIRYLSDIKNWDVFNRFTRLLAALSGQEINYTQLGREIGITPKTAEAWVLLLKATFQWFEISPFSMNAIQRIRVSSRSKGYMSDVGALCYLQYIATAQGLGGHPLWGAIFETAVVSEIRKQANMLAMPPGLYHWRAHSGAEVDLVLEWNGRHYPIEIKGKTNPSKSDTLGLKAFRSRYDHLNIAPGLILYPGDKAFKITDHDYCLPWNFVADKSLSSVLEEK